MQAIDVLRDDTAHDTGVLERRERAMSCIRLRCGQARPAEQRARPVAAPIVFLVDELAVLQRRAWPRWRVDAAVVGNARLRGTARTGERDDPAAARHVHQCTDVHDGRLAYFLAT